MKNDQWLQKLLAELEHIKSPFWKSFPIVKLEYSNLYKVALGPEAKNSIPSVFGNSFFKRFKKFYRNLGKIKNLNFYACLPGDSIVFLQPTRERIIVVSKKENIALKISHSAGQLSLLSFEVEHLKFLERTPFAEFTYSHLDHGINWIITSFASNDNSLITKSNPASFLLENVNLFMNPMAKFYEAHGVERIKLVEWLAEAKNRSVGHPNEKLLVILINCLTNEVKDFPDAPVLKVQSHFDLHAGNILLSDNKMTFIDWEITTRGLAIIDYFDFLRRFLNQNKSEKKKFLNYLVGTDPLSNYCKNFFQDFNEWTTQFSFKLPKQDITMPMLYVIERSLIYFERWKEDRLADQKGLEYLIAISISKRIQN